MTVFFHVLFSYTALTASGRFRYKFFCQKREVTTAIYWKNRKAHGVVKATSSENGSDTIETAQKKRSHRN